MKRITITSLLASFALFLGACGNDASKQNAAPPPSDDGVRTIAITANDSMQFSVTSIEAAPGEEIRIQLSNIGRMPKQSMAHNWVLLQPMDNAAINAFGMKASSHAPEYIPAGASEVIAHTKMLGAGESDTLTFKAPSAPGPYPFICSFPGHYAIMKGTLTVK
ncbi:azurin [Pelagicoccus sp. SDUM812005]|uniref:azurin n=1 Tax=Pelagicoccus sp. SDUM812005 TaxID=3041257 RepID=UPI00280D1711|nr:azurin [Pelagicoccus sp. SDUM812005]MDQ8182280.1 azurin [Pelagicoccus sp. SDUM812005]